MNGILSTGILRSLWTIFILKDFYDGILLLHSQLTKQDSLYRL